MIIIYLMCYVESEDNFFGQYTYICSWLLCGVLDKCNWPSNNTIGFKMKYDKACRKNHSDWLSNLSKKLHPRMWKIYHGHQPYVPPCPTTIGLSLIMPYHCGILKIRSHVINPIILQSLMKKTTFHYCD